MHVAQKIDSWELFTAAREFSHNPIHKTLQHWVYLKFQKLSAKYLVLQSAILMCEIALKLTYKHL